MARRTRLFVAASLWIICFPSFGASQVGTVIPADSKVFIAPMDGLETYLAAGLHAKKVPVTVVADRDKADYEITGTPEIENVEGTKGWQKVAEIGLTRRHTGDYSKVRVSWSVKSVKSGDVVFAYSVDKAGNHPQQSAAEAFAKHLKDQMSKK